MNHPEPAVRAEWLTAGRKVRKNGDEVWTAGADTDRSRWMHPHGQRTVSDNTVQGWLDRGIAEVLP